MMYSNSSVRDIQKLCTAIDALHIRKEDITQFPCDIIVCPDGKMLDGVGGLARKIHQLAGPMLKKATARQGECLAGQIKVTEAFQLKAKYIIHTVSPAWKGGIYGEEMQLANCYSAAIQKAYDLLSKATAFPSIGTGYHKFPKERAAEIAVNTIIYHMVNATWGMQVSIFCADDETYEAYKKAVKQVVVKSFLYFYSPENCACNPLLQKNMGPYYSWMIKLKDLETIPHQYSDYIDKIGFKDTTHPELNASQRYYLLSQKAHLWDYRTCLAYIIYLQRKSHWDGYVSYEAEQCKLGGIRNVLIRMQELLR